MLHFDLFICQQVTCFLRITEYSLNKKTPAAQEQSSAATYEHLWWAFSGYLRQELKKLKLTTGVSYFCQNFRKTA